MSASRVRSALACGVLVPLAACATLRPSDHAHEQTAGKYISSKQIERSGAKTAWEAVRRAGTHLPVRQNSRGDQTRISSRGPSSILLDSQVLVIVDGAFLGDWTYLREIPARTVSYIRVLTGPQATPRYGTPAGNGAIVVATQPPPAL